MLGMYSTSGVSDKKWQPAMRSIICLRTRTNTALVFLLLLLLLVLLSPWPRISGKTTRAIILKLFVHIHEQIAVIRKEYIRV